MKNITVKDLKEVLNECPEFKPEVIKSQPIYDTIDNYVGMLDPMLVVCEQRITCRRFMEYLQKCLIIKKGEIYYDGDK